MSSFYKKNGRKWTIYHQRVLTAIQPKWLWQTNPKYFDIGALSNDNSPIAKVLTATAAAADTDNAVH